MGELLIRVLLVKLVEGTRWRAKDKWKHPQTLPLLQVTQLMTTNSKRPRQSFKSTQCRELRLLRYFPGEESFRRKALQGSHWGKREKL